MPDPTLLGRALRGEPVPRPPVWFMRQAGRYMPVYRALRERVSFLELCADADLCCEVAMQPLDRFGFDAAIVFSDILLPLDCMGAGLSFEKGMGPRLANPVRSRADVDALGDFDPARDLPTPMRAIQLTAAASGLPVLGFAGAPFTMACYLVQGASSKDWSTVKQLMWTDPDAFQALLDRLADAVGAHLQAQAEAGAAAVQLFDTWAGVLAPDDYRRWALPAARRALAHVKDTPTLYFTRDSAPFLPWLAETGATAVGLDWRVELSSARQVLGTLPVQGNLDPSVLYAPHDTIRTRVRRVIEQAGPRGHVFNLGHGITPATPESAVQAAVDAVQAWRWPED